MPADALKTAIAIADNASYDYHNKKEWRSKGMAVLRRLVKDLGLVKGEYDLHFMEGGQAVPGDCVLHTDRIYILLTSSICADAGYARAVKSRKDYTGERNISIPKSYASLLRIAQGLHTRGAATQVTA